jgi:hypothetical protein
VKNRENELKKISKKFGMVAKLPTHVRGGRQKEGKILEEILADKFLNLMKNFNLQIVKEQ